jgi:MFS family permease
MADNSNNRINPKEKSKIVVPEESLHEKTNKSLKSSIKDGSAYAAMEGFGKSYLTPFALALKASTTTIGLLASLPDLLGSIFQLSSTRLVELFKSRKKLIVFFAFLQALTWIPLLFVPALKENGPVFLLIFITLQAIFGYIINPLWTSLMGDLVPEHERGTYFGKRNMITGIFSFASMFLAGYLLSTFSTIGPFIGFLILFMIALTARFISVYYLTKMYDPPYLAEKKDYFSFVDFVKRMRYTNYGKFVIYLCLLHLIAYVGSPFFAVYMIRDLKFSYLTFTILESASLLASFLGMYVWGKINDKYGSRKLLYINGFLVGLNPIFWVMTTNPYIIFAIEIFSGFTWAGFNLGAANFIYDATTPQKRTRCVVYYNVLNGLAIFIGAMIGGFLALHMGTFGFISTLPVLFIITGVGRIVVSGIFLPMLKEMRLIEVPIGHSFFRTFLHIKPRHGAIYETIGTYKKQEKPMPVKKIEPKKPPEKPKPPIQQDPKLFKKNVMDPILKNVKK